MMKNVNDFCYLDPKAKAVQRTRRRENVVARLQFATGACLHVLNTKSRDDHTQCLKCINL